MLLLSIPDFIARFHPVLVHLPIGILVLACLFQWLSIRDRYVFLLPVIPVALFWGMLGAVVSCISGYLLARSGDYDAALVQKHQWFGISVAVFSALLYLLHKISISEILARWLSLVLIILITITGHLGGTLTHGEGYLTASLGGEEKKKISVKPIANINEAVVYADLVQPILESKCYSCHSAKKQKGKLRLDTPEFIMKGGKGGEVVLFGKADESELIKRIYLPLGDEDHMPPKAKPQLTENEVLLLNWWVNSNAGFDKKVNALVQTEKIIPVLQSFQSGTTEKKMSDVPETPVEKADESIVNRLRAAGVIVLPVSRNSNYLLVNFVSASATADTTLKLLPLLSKQLVWLRLDDTNITDSSLRHIEKCIAITRLQLNNTQITDQALPALKELSKLKSLNLVGTKVTTAGLLQLKTLPELKSIFLYKTGVVPADWDLLQKTFPKVQIDTGRYTVPTFANDTTMIKF